MKLKKPMNQYKLNLKDIVKKKPFTILIIVFLQFIAKIQLVAIILFSAYILYVGIETISTENLIKIYTLAIVGYMFLKYSVKIMVINLMKKEFLKKN